MELVIKARSQLRRIVSPGSLVSVCPGIVFYLLIFSKIHLFYWLMSTPTILCCSQRIRCRRCPLHVVPLTVTAHSFHWPNLVSVKAPNNAIGSSLGVQPPLTYLSRCDRPTALPAIRFVPAPPGRPLPSSVARLGKIHRPIWQP